MPLHLVKALSEKAQSCDRPGSAIPLAFHGSFFDKHKTTFALTQTF